MGRFKIGNERGADPTRKRKMRCEKGYHQESSNKPGYCVHCGLKRESKQNFQSSDKTSQVPRPT